MTMAHTREKLAAAGMVGGVAAISLLVLVRCWSGGGLSEASGASDCPARRAARGESVPLMIKAREKPVAVTPVPGLADAVSESQMLKALCASAPMWHPPTVPSLIHELKLWGQGADFTKVMVGQERSGRIMRETLLSDKLCRERTTPNGASFLIDSPFGIHVVQSGSRDAGGNRAEGHYGQLLMVLGEAGVPLQTPVRTVSGRTGTVADLLQDAVMRFLWTRELEFVGCALALWLPPSVTWTDQFGNRYSFDELVEHLLAIPWGEGACSGTHVPYAVASILCVAAQYPLLSPSVRKRSVRWLSELSQHLDRSQRAEGGWDENWAGTDTTPRLFGNPVLDRITVTGHHLEWIALTPSAARPSRATVQRAASACVADIERLPPVPRRSFKTILPCSHAARALCLLRGEDPFSAWIAHWRAKRVTVGKAGLELRQEGSDP